MSEHARVEYTLPFGTREDKEIDCISVLNQAASQLLMDDPAAIRRVADWFHSWAHDRANSFEGQDNE